MATRHTFHEQLRRERELRGWTREELAERLGCDPKTIARWENGTREPFPHFRQQLIQLFGSHLGLSPQQSRYEDLGEMPANVEVYGRTRECDILEEWLTQPDCRIGIILGMGGAGKTTLTAHVVERARRQFDLVFWRFLQDAPSFPLFVKQCLELSPSTPHVEVPRTTDEQITLLLESFRQHRWLVVLDNFETLLQAGRSAGHLREEYTAYGQLLRRVGETRHQSCLLLTSREKPQEIARLEGRQVHSLTLPGLDVAAGQQLLLPQDLVGNEQAWQHLIAYYKGNPLALRLVATVIQEVFGGDIARFLRQETTVFGDIQELLAQHFARLSSQEQEVVFWLAIEREPVSVEILQDDLANPSLKGLVPDACSSLLRRSLIEKRGQGLFSLQPVILEYVTALLVERLSQEWTTNTCDMWRCYGLMKAHTSEYIRENQERLLLAPVAHHLLLNLGLKRIEQIARAHLERQRQTPVSAGYLAANILHLLTHLKGDLRGMDFSHLLIRQAYLQGALLPEVRFTGARFVEPLFTDTFGDILSVATHQMKRVFAVGTTEGEIRIYDMMSYALRLICRGHTDGVWQLAFNADGTLLASGSDDHRIRLWDTLSGSCLGVLTGHTNRVRALAFHPEGRVLASGSDDQQIFLWDVATGQCFKQFTGHTGRIWSVAFHRSGELLASGSTDQTIRLWNISQAICQLVLTGHSDAIRAVAFHPEEEVLVSGSDDCSVRVWDLTTGACVRTVSGHRNRVWSLAISSYGTYLASASEDQTICIWQNVGEFRASVLTGHTRGVRSLAFFPDTSLLVSGGDDGMVRVWDARAGTCLSALQGYARRILSLAFSPQGDRLVTGSEDSTIRIWDWAAGCCLSTLQDRHHGLLSLTCASSGLLIASAGQDHTIRLWDGTGGIQQALLEGHTNWLRTVQFSPTGRYLASGGEDWHIRLWDPVSCTCLQLLIGHTSWVRAVAFSPDEQTLASCGDDHTVRLWNIQSGVCTHILQGHTGRVRALAIHPDGEFLASSGEDQQMILWHLASGEQIASIPISSGWLRSVAFRPDGHLLAGGNENGTLHFWAVPSWQEEQTLQAHTARVRQICFPPHGQTLASCSDDGTSIIWETSTGLCLARVANERPYEHMNIRDVQGLTDAQKAILRILGARE